MISLIRPYLILGDYSTVEPLSNDHPHQRPSLLYDHISCDGQCFLFVRSLTSDHPSDATRSDGIFSPADDHIAYSTNTKRLRIACKKCLMTRPAIIVDSVRPNESIRACRMEKGKSLTLGSARCRFKRLRRVETKVEIKQK